MPKKVYIGSGNVARSTRKMYVGVDGVARGIKKGYVGVDGVARQFWPLGEYDALILQLNAGATLQIGATPRSMSTCLYSTDKGATWQPLSSTLQITSQSEFDDVVLLKGDWRTATDGFNSLFYSSDDTGAIRRIAGSVFSIYSSNTQPGVGFADAMFSGHRNLLQILNKTEALALFGVMPKYDSLFEGFDVIVPTVDMFTGTFYGCRSLQAIPDGLFSGISGAPADRTFYGTFQNCRSLQAIPDGLFSGISGAPAPYVFYSTFQNCIGLQAIPDGLFSGISGAPADRTFYCTFQGCTSLQTIPSNLFSGISGVPADYMFGNTFYGCTSLQAIPGNLFSGISGAPAADMFYCTFQGCTSLQAIPSNLFSGISGAPAPYMFANTFYGCTSLQAIPSGLFSGISGGIARSMFSQTFSGCAKVSSIAETLSNPALTGVLTGTVERYADTFYRMFFGCGTDSTVSTISVADGSTTAHDRLFGSPLSSLYSVTASSMLAFNGSGWSGKYSGYANIPDNWK